MKKLCKKKCKKCKGTKCPNYSKTILDFSQYYEGILHSKSINFDIQDVNRWNELYKKKSIKMRRFLNETNN